MQLYQMEDKDINDVMGMAMNATLASLVKENLLPEDKAVKFRDTHVCLKVDNNNIWRWVKKKLGLESKDDAYWAVVFSSSAFKEEPKNEPLV